MLNVKISVILLLTLLITLVIVMMKTKEQFTNNKINIGIIIPTTSNKRDFKVAQDIDFFKILMPGFLKNCSNEYNYTFYLGIDHDDAFFLKEQENILSHFNKITKGKLG